MLYVFVGCLSFGILYALGSLFFGAGDTDGGADGGDLPSPFNPLVMASAITTFGAAGLIGKAGFGLGNGASSVLGLLVAGVVGAAMFFGVVRLMYNSQSDSTFSLNDLVGTEAEVTTPLPEKGMGEIACMVSGVRYCMPAQASDGAVAKGEIVYIREIKGSMALVARKMTLEDYEQLEQEHRRSGEKENNQ